MRCCGGAGPTTMTASRVGSTSSSSRPTMPVGVAQRAARGAARAARRTRTDRRGRRARDRTPRRARPNRLVHDVAERGEHRVGIEPHAERRARRRLASSPRSTRPPRHLPVAGHQRRRPRCRRYGGTRSSGVLGSVPSPLAITARAMPAFAQLVAERARPRRRRARCRCSSITSVIGMYTRPWPGGMPGAGAEHTTGAVAPEVSSTPKPWPAVCDAGGGARARARRSRSCCRSGSGGRRRW